MRYDFIRSCQAALDEEDDVQDLILTQERCFKVKVCLDAIYDDSINSNFIPWSWIHL